MSPSHLRTAALVVIATVMLGAAAPASAAGRRCGRIEIPTRALRAKVRVIAGHASCRAARQQIAAAYEAEDTRHWDGYANPDGVFWRVRGWRCFIGLGGSQTFCSRRHQRVDGSLRRDDGWSF